MDAAMELQEKVSVGRPSLPLFASPDSACQEYFSLLHRLHCIFSFPYYSDDGNMIVVRVLGLVGSCWILPSWS